MSRSRLLGLVILLALATIMRAAEPAGVTIDATSYIDRTKGDCGIQAAIDEAARQGGGTIVLPAGTFVLNRYLEMRDNCTLKGQGEKTILTLGKANGYASVIAQDDAKTPETLTLDGDLGTLKVGTQVTIYPSGLNTHAVHLIKTRVTAIDGNRVTFEDKIRTCAPQNGAYLDWGLVTTLLATTKKGETTIRIANPEWLGPQQGLYYTGRGDVWNHQYNAVVKVEGDVVTLERPITVEAEKGSEVVLMHSAITGERNLETMEWLKNVTILDLTIDGRADELQLPHANFMQAGVHFNRCENLTIRNVTVRDWYTDGISVQGQKNVLVENCRAIGNHGRGLHPGTGVDVGLFLNCVSQKNSGDGLFFCFGNKKVVVRGCTLSDNGGDGIGGLGYGAPSDTQNTVENNLIERNGKSGVECSGGGITGNVVRNNIIRDNSQSKPGAYPGVLIFAMKKGAESVTIVDNTIESTLDTPTQLVGIEERHTVQQPKREKGQKPEDAPPAEIVKLANNNTITGNTLSGHQTADIIVCGPDSVAEKNTGTVIEHRTGLGPVK